MSSLDKALSILARFSAERPSLSVTEVAAELGIPKSSVSRLMKTMADAELITAQPGRRGYSPGPLAFRLGNLYRSQLRVMDLVDAAVVEIVERYGLTGYVGVLNGSDVVLLGVHQGRFPIRLVLERGARVPAHVSALGQAMLSRLDEDQIAALYPATVHYSETGITANKKDILERARYVRKQGYATVEGVTFRGFNAVGVAVDSAIERQCVGFSLSYPQEMLSRFNLAEIIEALVESAASIGERIGDPYWIADANARRGSRMQNGSSVVVQADPAKNNSPDGEDDGHSRTHDPTRRI
jgi:DNA-binding IclR family transcriptional regulator